VGSKFSKVSFAVTLRPYDFSLIGIQGNQVEAVVSQNLSEPFKLTPGILKDGSLEKYSDTIQMMIQGSGLDGNGVDIIIDESMVIIKTIPVAMGLEESAVQDQLQWEADGYLIAPLSDYILEFEKLPIQTKEGNPVYIMVCIRKKLIHILQSMIDRIGMKMTSLEVDVFAYIRALKANYNLKKKDICAIADVQKGTIKLILLQKGDYFLSHQIVFDREKYGSGAVTSNEMVKRLTKELNRLIFGHNLGRQIEDLGGLYLVGTDDVHQIANSLEAQLSIPVAILNPFQKVRVAEHVSNQEVFRHFPERFGANLGASLKNMPDLAVS